MAANEVKITLEVDDKGSPQVKGFADTVKRELAGVSGASKDAGASAGVLSSAWVGTAAKFLASTAVIYGVKNALSAFLDEAAEAEQIENRLKFALETTGYSWQLAKSNVDDFAESVQKMTRFSDEQAREALTDMMLYTRDFSKAQEASRLAMDMSVRTGQDLRSSTRLIGMAISGNVEMLGRYIPELRNLENVLGKDATATEKADYAFKTLQQKFAGTAAADVNTYSGAVAQLSNEWSDFKELLGGFLIGPATDLVKWLKDAVGGVKALVDVFRSPKTEVEALQKELKGVNRELELISKWFKEGEKGTFGFGLSKEAAEEASGRYDKLIARKAEIEKALGTGPGKMESFKDVFPKESKAGEQAKEMLKTQEQQIQLALEYYQIEQKMAEAQDDWGERRTSAIAMQEKLYRELLEAKVDEINANDKIAARDKENLIVRTRDLFGQQEKQRALDRTGPALQAEKNALEAMAAEEARMNPMFPDDAYNMKMLANEAERARVALEAEQKALEAMAAEEVRMNPMFPDDAYNMKMLANEAERAARAAEMERRAREMMPGVRMESAALSGDWDAMKRAEQDLLQIEMERIIRENQLTGIYKEQVEILYQQKKAISEAQRTMNIPALIDIGAQKAAIDYNKQLADQYMNLIPNAIDMSTGALSGFFRDLRSGTMSTSDALKKMADNFIEGTMRMIEEIGLLIIKMEILKSLGYSTGGMNIGGGGGAYTPGTGPGWSQLITGVPGAPIALQEGGAGWVNRPTLFLAGEGGEDEYVNVVPRSKMSSQPSINNQQSGQRQRPIAVNVHMTINTPDGNSFRSSRDQIAGQLAIATQRAMKKF